MHPTWTEWTRDNFISFLNQHDHFNIGFETTKTSALLGILNILLENITCQSFSITTDTESLEDLMDSLSESCINFRFDTEDGKIVAHNKSCTSNQGLGSSV